jgi:hypothetical protein
MVGLFLPAASAATALFGSYRKLSSPSRLSSL